MRDIPEKFVTLRRVTSLIETTDNELTQAHFDATQRAKRHTRDAAARDALEEAKTKLRAKTEATTARFLRDAAAHDVSHAIHKARAPA